MKKYCFLLTSLAFIFALEAQGSIRVNYKGSKPTISDFASTYLSAIVYDDDDCIDEASNAFKQAWTRYRKGITQPKGEKIIVDQKNGYLLYESQHEEHLLRIEMCYWNETDGKHKLVAVNTASFINGVYNPGQYDHLSFYRYTNATKKMTMCDAPGFEVAYAENGAWISYALPRTGKNIIATYWNQDGKKKQKTLKWNGRKFSF